MKKLLLALLLLPAFAHAQAVRFPNCPKTVTETVSPTQKVFGCPAVGVGIVSSWPLSADGSDAVSSNTLTNNNSVTFVPLGPSGVVAVFTAANTESLSYTGAILDFTADWTIAFWFNSDDTGNYRLISTGNLPIDVYHSGTTVTAYFKAASYSRAATLSNTAWHFVVVNQSGTTFGLSVDGGAFDTVAGAANNAATSFKVGVYPDNSTPLNGKVARVGAWSNDVDASVITSLYNAGKGKAYAQLTTADKVGLVSYWNLDEASGNRADSFGAYTLTDNNTVTSTTNSYPANVPGTVANFVAASNQYFSRAGGVAAYSGATFTGEFWTYQTSFAARELLWCGGAAGTPAIQLEADGDITIYATATDYMLTTVTNVLPNDQWNQIVVTFDGGEATHTDRFKLYVNGSPVTLVLGSGAIPTTIALGDPFELGRYGGGGFQWNGRVSSPKVWSRVLTSDERTYLDNAGAGRNLSFN